MLDWNRCVVVLACFGFLSLAGATRASGQAASGPIRITLDQAIDMAIEHNHNTLAQRTTITQSEAQEITAGLRPNPTLFVDWDYLPFASPASQNPDLYAGQSTGTYLKNNTEGDIGMSYLIERGGKRRDRLQAQRDITAQTRSLVADNERTITFQVATLSTNVQLAESTIELAQQDLKSFQQTIEIAQRQFSVGAISEGDYLKIELQLLQFETDLQQAEVARVQGLSDLRQQLGYESVPADYDVAETFDYIPLNANVQDLQMKALQNRPDLGAAQQGVTAANSTWRLARANGVQDLTVQGNYSHVNGINGFSVLASIPLPSTTATKVKSRGRVR